MLGEAQGEREDRSAQGLLAPLAAANKGKKCRGRGPPALHPAVPPPPFHSLDPLGPSSGDGGGRAAALPARSLLCSPMGSLAAGEGMGPQGAPGIPEPHLHPKGPQTISTPLSGSGAAKKQAVPCRSPGGEGQRGARPPQQYRLAPRAGWVHREPRAPTGAQGCRAPPDTVRSDQPSGGQWDQHHGKSCSPGAPQTCTPGLVVQWGSLGRG